MGTKRLSCPRNMSTTYEPDLTTARVLILADLNRNADEAAILISYFCCDRQFNSKTQIKCLFVTKVIISDYW